MKHELTFDDMKRFWGKVRVAERTNCWEWTGSRTSDKGDGRQTPTMHLRGGHKLSARRVSYLIHFGGRGKLPRFVGCTCENRLCVNPAHLTPEVSGPACVRRYSSKPSEKWARVTDRLVARILRLRKDGMTQPEIAREVGIKQSRVCLILRMARLCKENKIRTARRTA